MTRARKRKKKDSPDASENLRENEAEVQSDFCVSDEDIGQFETTVYKQMWRKN